jgi:hypothetical protein
VRGKGVQWFCPFMDSVWKKLLKPTQHYKPIQQCSN